MPTHTSQSMLKSWDSCGKIEKDSYRQCEIYFAKYYLLGEAPGEPEIYDPKLAFHQGLWFENRLIGATRSGNPVNFAWTKGSVNVKPKPYTAENDLQAVVDYAKGIVKEYPIVSVLDDVQPYWKVDSLLIDGHPDWIPHLNGERVIIDIKYTAMKESDGFNDQQWKFPEFRDHMQAVHYVIMSKELYGKYLPFYYMVFGKSKWVKWIKIEVTEDAIKEHMSKVHELQAAMMDFTPQPCGKFNVCRNCPFIETCPSPTLVPELETIVYNGPAKR